MSRKLNLRLPSYHECLLERSVSNPTNATPAISTYKSSSSLKFLRESLNKTSEKLLEISQCATPVLTPIPLQKTPAELQEENNFLRTKIQRLEQEKNNLLAQNTLTEEVSKKIQIKTLTSVIKNAASEMIKKIKEKNEWNQIFLNKVVSEDEFFEKIREKDYGGALLQLMDFVKDIGGNNENEETMLKDPNATLPIRKEVKGFSAYRPKISNSAFSLQKN